MGFNRSQFLGEGSGDPGGGGSGSHNSLLSSGRFVPGAYDGLGGIPDREDSSDFIQQQHDSQGSPKRDTGWGNIAQRFEQTAAYQIAISANQPAVSLAIVGLGTTTMTMTTNRGSDPDVSDSVPHSGEHIVDNDHDGNGGGKETSHGSGGACMHPVNNDDCPHLPGNRHRPERDHETPRGIARGPRSVVDGRAEARMKRGGE